MTAICVAGSHRSGTSMVTRLLHGCGVDLGRDDELMPPRPDNAGGFFENLRFVELNDRLLDALGGAWDFPPPPADWTADRFALLRTEAAALAGEFADRPAWGWKDPRNSLTFGFWRTLVPGLVPVVVVRNPLDVAASLRRRNALSEAFGLTLWRRYNERLLEATEPPARVVTHYDAYFERPRAELERVLAAIGVEPGDAALDAAVAQVESEARHHRARPRALVEADVAPDVVALYAQLCAEAGWDVRLPRAAPRTARRPAAGDRSSGRPRPDALEPAAVARELADLRGHLATQRTSSGALAERLARQEAAVDRILAELQALRTQFGRGVGNLESSLAALSTAALGDAAGTDVQRVQQALARGRIAAALDDAVPPGAAVLVAGGDAAELAQSLEGRTLVDFLAQEDGADLPVTDTVPLAQLEYARATGAGFLFVPAASRWLLRKYPRLARHVARRYGAALDVPDVGVLYALRDAAVAPAAGWEVDVEAAIAEFRTRFDRDPAILDCTAGGLVAAAFGEHTVFAPPAAGPELPYIDESVDIVVVDDDGAEDEAWRVAAGAVLHVEPGEPPAVAAVRWRPGAAAARPPSASIVIPTYNAMHHTEPCLRALADTLPPTHEIEIVVVDDGSTDDTAERLARAAERDARIRVVRNDENAGYLRSCNRGAAVARGDVLVMLNNDTVPLPGWLDALLRTFRHEPRAGAVTGKLLFPDGTLQEAGGLIFSDGRGANFGKWQSDPDDPLFDHVRDVDYGSGALLAVPKALWEQLGGYDERYAPGYCEDADLCFQVRAAGLRVLYQPDAVVVHAEGGTAGRDVDAGMKRHQALNWPKLVERWGAELALQPPYPARFDRVTLHELAAGGVAEAAR